MFGDQVVFNNSLIDGQANLGNLTENFKINGGEAQSGDHNEEEEEEQAQIERPQLDEGFFEIEAIRRKRVRKGQLQYLIKWRGWPEASNTWEPLENLQTCSDVITAFNKSLRYGKPSRKKTRKHGDAYSQQRKKQPSVLCGAMSLEMSVDKRSLTSNVSNRSLFAMPSPNSFECYDPAETDRVFPEVIEAVQANEKNESLNGLSQTSEKKESPQDDRSPMGSQSADAENADKPPGFQDGNPCDGDASLNGLPFLNCLESVQSNRCTGAKRRKSGSVKRFRKDAASEAVFSQHSASNFSVASGRTVQAGVENHLKTINFGHEGIAEDSINVPAITRIIKAISFSSNVLDNIQDVLVMFVAVRSDGEEVVVDNKYLKANNPLLLIDFYEQHLRYNS